MRIGVPAETRPGETRVAATPETVKKLVAGKHQVMVQSGAGVPASFDRRGVCGRRRHARRARPMRWAPKWCSRCARRAEQELRADEARHRAGRHARTVRRRRHRRDGRRRPDRFALEAAPRTTRAQSMDVLSSQANIAGYKAVMLAAERLPALHADADDRRRHREGGARA